MVERFGRDAFSLRSTLCPKTIDVSPTCSCDCLEHEGVTCVFGIPGEENIYLTDALVPVVIRYVLVRHEQAASFMAEIYGRLTGRAGVCSATLGPGRHQPAAGDGRRQHQQHPGRGPLGPGGAEPDLQGVPSERRSGVHVLAGDQVGRHWSSPRARSPRWSARRSSWPRPNARERSTSAVPEDIESQTVAERLAPLEHQHPSTRRAVTLADRPGGRRAQREPAVPSSWPGTARPAAVRPRPCGASPSCWASRWPRPFTARACSPTITRTPSARSDS